MYANGQSVNYNAPMVAQAPQVNALQQFYQRGAQQMMSPQQAAAWTQGMQQQQQQAAYANIMTNPQGAPQGAYPNVSQMAQQAGMGNPNVPSPGGAGLTNLPPTRGGFGGMSPQVQALMRQYQANQALQNRLSQQNYANPPLAPQPMQPVSNAMVPMNPQYQGAMNPQTVAPQGPQFAGMGGGGMSPGAAGLMRFYQR